MLNVIKILTKLYSIVKDFFGNKLDPNVSTNIIKDSSISVQNGNFVQANTTVKLEKRDSVEEFANQITKFLGENRIVDLNNGKFQYYVNHTIHILTLNDSQTKRKILKDLLYKKFCGAEQGIDDSDAPTTIALEAMKFLTDIVLFHLCSYRLLINVIPSVIKNDVAQDQEQLAEFINEHGLMTQVEINNLSRLGVIDKMEDKIYSLSDIISNDKIYRKFKNIDTLDNPFLLSSRLTPAGILITDILLERVFRFDYSYESWLPMTNKSLHVNELVVDKDALVNQNMVVKGDTSSGGVGTSDTK